MQLIFIRHGEPDYEHDSLTAAGFREAELLGRRMQNWPDADYFVSPLGRAKATAHTALTAQGRGGTAEEKDWLHEFYCGDYVPPPEWGTPGRVPWDFYPGYWTADARYGERDHWTEPALMRQMPVDVKSRFETVSAGLDGLLAAYGYVREQGVYRVADGAKRDAVLVFFCHLGITGALCGHLLNIAPPLLWQSFFLPASSVTVLNTEERVAGTAAFRCQVMGSTAHLPRGGQPVSGMGAFGPVFQG